MRKEISSEVLGLYILFLALGQAVLQVFISREAEGPGYYFYFDPRIGLFALCEMLRLHALVCRVASWISAGLLGGIGFLQLSGRRVLRTYIAFEVICSLPSVFFFSLVALVNIGPTHGFSRAELQFPLVVFLFFSVVPVAWAIRLLLSSAARRDTSDQIDLPKPTH